MAPLCWVASLTRRSAIGRAASRRQYPNHQPLLAHQRCLSRLRGSAFNPRPGQEAALERALIRAMIGAAKADGQIDTREQQRIHEQVKVLGLDTGMQAFATEELGRPLDVNDIVAPAVCPETAAEIYAASLLAADRSRAAEKGYLAMLAARVKLDTGLVKHLHANVGHAL